MSWVHKYTLSVYKVNTLVSPTPKSNTTAYNQQYSFSFNSWIFLKINRDANVPAGAQYFTILCSYTTQCYYCAVETLLVNTVSIHASLWSNCPECCIFSNIFSIFLYCMSVHLSMCCPPSLSGDGNGILAEVWLKGHFLLGDHPTVSLFSSPLFLRGDRQKPWVREQKGLIAGSCSAS